MVGPIRLFQSLRGYYQMMGIYSPESSNQRYSINGRNSFFLFCYTQLLISSVLFLLFEAETTLEFGAAIYALLAESFCIWYFLMKMWRMPRILRLIDGFDAFMEKSKCIQLIWMKYFVNDFFFSQYSNLCRSAWKNHVLWIDSKNWTHEWTFAHCSGKIITFGYFSAVSHYNDGQLLLVGHEKWVILLAISGDVSRISEKLNRIAAIYSERLLFLYKFTIQLENTTWIHASLNCSGHINFCNTSLRHLNS